MRPQTSIPASPAPLALVAGASRGLGLQIARELGTRGFRLALCARNSDALDRAADLLRDEGIEVVAQTCDVGDVDAVNALVERLERDFGGIEVLFCVAGIIQVGPLANLRRSHIEAAVQTMLWGPVNTALAVTPAMQSRGRGRIALITSVGGLIAAPHLLPYSTAKFGAVGFGKSLRNELSGTGVTVTTVTPGLMRTGSHLHAWFVGRQAQEFGWFSIAASTPLLSIDARRAARRIVTAALDGRATVAPTPLAFLAPRVEALAPRATAALLGFTARRLPAATPDQSPSEVEGFEAAQLLSRPARTILDRLTVLGRRAAMRLNERSQAGTTAERSESAGLQ
jgi:NAD(P)-dependent dehydrogenase (short-subunit alcohol dehydrogenase family)